MRPKLGGGGERPERGRGRTSGSRRERGAADHYLHALLVLTEHGQQADTGDVAARVGVSTAAASQMLRRLAEEGLVKVAPYEGAELTTEGLHRALRVVRRHRLLEVFLVRSLGFSLEEIHARALAIQPAVDEEFEDRLDRMLEHPRVDPHGKPIPDRNARWPKLGDAPATALPSGAAGVVSRILTEDGKVRDYLRGMGIDVGVTLTVDGIAPFDGPVSLRVGERVVHLGRRIAECIHLDAVTTDGPLQCEHAPEARRLRRRRAK